MKRFFSFITNCAAFALFWEALSMPFLLLFFAGDAVRRRQERRMRNQDRDQNRN